MLIVGALAGILATLAFAVIIGRLPEKKPQHPRFSAICSGAAIDTESYGKFPSDWGGSVWNPPGAWRSPSGIA